MISKIGFAWTAFWNTRAKKTIRFIGTTREILTQTVEHLWNGNYFATGGTNYPHFWMRDFGLALPGLLAAEMKDRVYASLAFALAAYERRGHLTTMVNEKGVAHDFPGYALDTVGWLLASLRALDAKELVDQHRSLLTQELARVRTMLTDDGYLKDDARSFGIRDHLY